MDLNVNYKTMNPLQGNTGENLDDIGFGDDVSDSRMMKKLNFIKF